MKKFFAAVCVLLSSASLSAQTLTEIKGNISIDKVKEVTLYSIEDGMSKKYAVTNVAADGNYGFLISVPSEAFYTLGVGQKEYSVYAKPGDKITIDLTKTGAQLVGKNSKENVALYKWEDYSKTVRSKAVYFMEGNSTYIDFFPEFEKCVAGHKSVSDNVKSGNAKFDELLKAKINYDLDYYALKFIYTPRTAHPEKDQLISYYKTITSKDKFNSDVVLSIPEGSRMINLFASYINRESKSGLSENTLSYFKNDRIKGECVVENCRVKDYVAYEAFMGNFGKYITTPSQKQRMEEICAKVANSKPGEKASDFTYPDMNGKMVSLSDFVGKVVLVDVWATWCGPCRSQFPHLKALEKELHGNSNIVFMGVSVDEDKDKEAWKKMVKDEGLEGIQLFASGWSKIAKDYKIKGIPRFMVFDKKGNIYSIDAPRPSDPELKKILLKLAAE